VDVNGETVGRDTLANMAWTFEGMVAYASRGTWVRPGDVLGSGTCGNGGCLAELWGRHDAFEPQPLKPGDTVTIMAEGLGSVSNTVVEGVDPPSRSARCGSRRLRRTTDGCRLGEAVAGTDAGRGERQAARPARGSARPLCVTQRGTAFYAHALIWEVEQPSAGSP
jgi:fumarylacetoacetase-like protein